MICVPLFTIAITTVIISLTVVESTTITAISHYSAFSTSPKHYQNHYYNKYHEGILEIANSLLKILTNQIVDKTMVGAVKEK